MLWLLLDGSVGFFYGASFQVPYFLEFVGVLWVSSFVFQLFILDFLAPSDRAFGAVNTVVLEMWSTSSRQRFCILIRNVMYLGPVHEGLAYVSVRQMYNLYNIMPVLRLKTGLERRGTPRVVFAVTFFRYSQKVNHLSRIIAKIVYPVAPFDLPSGDDDPLLQSLMSPPERNCWSFSRIDLEAPAFQCLAATLEYLEVSTKWEIERSMIFRFWHPSPSVALPPDGFCRTSSLDPESQKLRSAFYSSRPLSGRAVRWSNDPI
ncbi:hypothetical protein Trydic_g22610 [Trypoxylus dichotomus]